MTEPFRVERPRGTSVPVVAHIPHAGVWIPDQERPRMLLGDAALARELLVMTDHHTDALFAWSVARGSTALVNQWSRLVLDPERFDDPAQEPMELVGQGVVYTRASDGAELRHADPVERERLLGLLYRPWHRALAGLVEESVARWGGCLVLDCHSFGTTPLPSEADQDPDRPDVCVGTDAWHTPPWLADALERSLRDEGFRVRRDSPFGGAIVPADRHRRDRRVRSVMLEVRRGTYCDEATGELLPGWEGVAARLERACLAAGVMSPGIPTARDAR